MIEIPFVETTAAKRIHAVIDLARQRGECATIIGQPGVGKTRALHEYTMTRPASRLMTLNWSARNRVRNLLLEIGEVMNFYLRGKAVSVGHQLSDHDLSDWVLLLDEAQNLNLQAVREVLTLHDHSKLIIVFCGNREVLGRVNAKAAEFGQVTDRIPLNQSVDDIEDTDADAIANAFGLEGLDAYRLARAIGRQFRIRALLRVLSAAREQAGERKTIKAAHIAEAVKLYPQFGSALK